MSIKGRVIVIDDEVNAATALETLLREDGYEVSRAHDAASGLALLEKTDADVVLSDLRMPGMDGHAFHDKLRAERPGLAARTVFITGDVLSNETRDTVQRQPVLAKPFSFDQVEEAVIALLRGGAPFRPAERPGVPR